MSPFCSVILNLGFVMPLVSCTTFFVCLFFLFFTHVIPVLPLFSNFAFWSAFSKNEEVVTQ